MKFATKYHKANRLSMALGFGLCLKLRLRLRVSGFHQGLDPKIQVLQPITQPLGATTPKFAIPKTSFNNSSCGL